MKEEKILINREIVYSSGIFIYVGIYFILISIISKILSYFNIGLNTFFSVLAAIAVAIGFLGILTSKALKDRFKKFVDKNIYRGQFDYRHIWHEFSENMASVVQLNHALEVIVKTLKNLSGVSDVDFLLSGGENLTYVSQLRSEKLSLKLDGKSKDWYIRYGNPFPVIDKFTNQYTSSLIMLLKKNEHTPPRIYALPLVYKRDLIGFIICEFESSNSLSRQEIDLLNTLSTESAIVINNLHMTQELIDIKKIEAYHRLSSFVVHDIKNMVSRLKLVIDNADSNISNPEFQKDMLSTLSNSVKRMTDLINKIGISDSESKLFLQSEFIPDILTDVLEQINLFQNPDIKFENVINKTGPSLKVNRSQLYKVFENIVINAIEAMPSGGRLKIATFYDNDYYTIEISDTGMGMSRDFIYEKLFHPFCSSKEKGLGIGMYHSNEIIKAHKGKIEVNSVEGESCQFTIKLPMVHASRRDNMVEQKRIESQVVA